jgi:hypothetical protein
MKISRLTFPFVLLAITASCSDDTGPGGGGQGGSGGATSSSSSSSPTSSSSTSGSSSSSSSSGQGGEGGSSPSEITADIVDVVLYADCMPIIDPDPINGTIDVDYTNTGSADGTLTVTEARLEITGIDATLIWTFDLDPATSGVVPAMDQASVTHTKVAGSGMGNSEPPCGYCGGMGTVTVTWTDGMGGTTQATEPATLECAF